MEPVASATVLSDQEGDERWTPRRNSRCDTPSGCPTGASTRIPVCCATWECSRSGPAGTASSSWDGQVAEHPDEHVTDSWTTLATIAADTERLRLGVMVNVLALKHPAEVARATVTLDLLSGGRLVFGAGLGSSAAEFQALGHDPDPRVRAEKLDEALQVLDGLWAGHPFTFHGRWFTVTDLAFQPVSPQRPRIPVWIAGTWPSRRPMRRAARWDGAFPTRAGLGHTQMMPPSDLEAVVSYVHAQQSIRNRPFDVVMEGLTSGSQQDTDAMVVAPYRAAGLTWWVEKLGWFRGPVELVRARIGSGPPRPANPRADVA
ncbi:LLM class flavin-dependent oxidoreductase [Kitasatospora sp. NPDC097605]|uniref:LLM class flavin-dependent oxidoreductase n=1 Tax=Kitasatospora sp. NPDC097605 TaxID=3157226 RepID=UPI0033242F6F